MRKLAIYLFAALLLAGCATPAIVSVTRLGEEPAEVLHKYRYALPQTVMKIEIAYREITDIPGPYWESADKYLGIKEVIKRRSSRWVLEDIKVTSHTEMDPDHGYTVNVMEGEVDWYFMEQLLTSGIIVDGTGIIHESTVTPLVGGIQQMDYQRYIDMGVYPNFEERTETMYKTIVTDTSFVRVPVERTIVEQKSPLKKAAETADLILELRSRRFDLLTGEYALFPQGEAMEAVLRKLDQLEASYLSLFTGKTISRRESRAYFIVPGAGQDPSRYRLGLFSEQLGFVPEELMEGEPLEVMISPTGQSSVLGINDRDLNEDPGLNKLYYRIPDVAELEVVLGEEVLSRHRISIYQSGGMLSIPIQP